jgi:hypothetical protein
MAAKLKVFVTSDGLTDYVVATTSRPKALEAWGVRQDLFKQGSAHEVVDPALITEASARPGEVLQRSTGADAALKSLKSPKSKKAGPSAADRRRVSDLEARIEALEAGREQRLAELREAREALKAREDREAETFEAEREALRSRLDHARRKLEP